MRRSPRPNRPTAAVEKDVAKDPENTPAPKPDTRSPEAKFADEIRLAGHRETIEAFVVAFILALLFRAFVAEAFVIPTGSMAPTLMGAHKDIACDECSAMFRIGASLENRASNVESTVVAGICPNCRHINALDLAGDANHATFSGDRILVSKFAYALHDPERWDVIVFKFPGNPKQNYIKRLVGLPQETLSINSGDVYVQDSQSDQPPVMLRKPPSTLLAMKHWVYDSDYQSPVLAAAKYPSRWQPWQENVKTPPEDSWKVVDELDSPVASVNTSDENQLYWLRYFHRWPTPEQWAKAHDGLSLANVNPYDSRAITDFYAYNSYINVNTDDVYEEKPYTPASGKLGRLISLKRWFTGDRGKFNVRYQSGADLSQFRSRESYGGFDNATDGMHWVGDLIVAADVETSAKSRELVLEIVEAGVKYQCVVDLGTGVAKLKINDSEPRSFADDEGKLATAPEAQTSLRSGERHRVRFSNCDDQLLLWVDDDLVAFDGPTTFDARKFRSPASNHPVYQAQGHPLDAAPIGVAVRGGTAKIHHLRVDRDQYYIAVNRSENGPLMDYSSEISQYVSGSKLAGIQKVLATPSSWNEFGGWQTRRTVTFKLDEDQFFPMGDNSPESQDARCWAGSKSGYGWPRAPDEDAYRWEYAEYVPRELLVGKALSVFWPHPWNSPVPFTPNLRRMKLIR